MLTRLAATAVVATLLLAGCTGSDQPADVARTDPPASSAGGSTDGTDDGPTGEPEATTDPPETEATLVFGGGNGATVPGCRPPRTYLAAYQTVEVRREVRLGEATALGGGRLVGDVLLLPAPRRGPGSQGIISIANRPSTGIARDLRGWEDRVALDGQLVQPGDYALFLQLEARPGRAVDGVSFGWFDSSATGSDTLELELRYARRCSD